MKNYFDINSEQDKIKAKEFIDKLDVNSGIRLFLDIKEKIKTLQQLKYFHKIVKEFTEFMINYGSQNGENDWKAIIKRNTHFFKSNTGVVAMEESLKKRMWLAIQQGYITQDGEVEKFTKEEKEKIIYCFREQSLKSLSEASSEEVSLLINEAIDVCINAFIGLVDCGINKKFLIEDLQINNSTLYDIIMKWKEHFENSNKINIDEKQKNIYDKIFSFFC